MKKAGQPMKIKKEYMFLFAVIAALIIYLAVQSQIRTHIKLPEIPKIASTEITKVEIGLPEHTISLTRNGSNWEIEPNNYKADTAVVNKILNSIGSLSLTAIVSKSQNYQRYGLNQSNRISVKAWTGKSLRREFAIGKTAPSYRHTFVTIPDDENVYHALDIFRHTFNKQIDDMRDKTIFSFDKSDISQIDIESERMTTSFHRQSPVKKGVEHEEKAAETTSPQQWVNLEGRIADSSIIDPLLDTLSDLKCSSYITDQTKGDFTYPIYTVTLSGKETYTLSIFEKINAEMEQYPAVSSHNKYVFLLSKPNADKLMGKSKDAKKNN